MLTAKQIASIIRTEIGTATGPGQYDGLWEDNAAQKIHDLCKPDHSIHVAAAALEGEYTDTLINMLLATVLATLIYEEGGGRTNITISPFKMSEVIDNWNYTVEMDGLIRTVRIAPKNEAEWEPGDGDEIVRGQLLKGIGPVIDSEEARPQAKPHEYNRPLWVVAAAWEDGAVFYPQSDRRSAEAELRTWPVERANAGLAHVENRWCLHGDCPSSGCNHDPSLRDTTEVASDAEGG